MAAGQQAPWKKRRSPPSWTSAAQFCSRQTLMASAARHSPCPVVDERRLSADNLCLALPSKNLGV